MKIAPLQQNLQSSVRWLRAFKESVPEVYKFDEAYNSVLMELLLPGNTLRDVVIAGEDDRATKLICDVIRKLQLQKTTEHQFPHIRTLGHSFAKLKGHLDERLRSKALTLFAELTDESTQNTLLHDDLHHANVLAADNSWKVIDPHGYMGTQSLN